MAEFWTTRDANGAYLNKLFTSREFAEGVVFVANRSKLGYFPHEVVHLVEAGTPDVCWHCHDVLEPQGRPYCPRCPADGECDVEGCDAPGCRELEEDDG